MAKPIEPTPVLKGEDAKRFYEMLEQEERKPNPKRIEFLRKCISVYGQLPSK